MKKKPTIALEIEIPIVPNFIRIIPGVTAPISRFTEKELRAIGREWTNELIRKAKKKDAPHAK